MATIHPFILFVLSLATLLGVIVRRYPQLTLLDVENVSKIKETKKKNEFVRKRSEEQLHKTKGMVTGKLSSAGDGARKLFRGFVVNVKEKAEKIQIPKAISKVNKANKKIKIVKEEVKIEEKIERKTVVEKTREIKERLAKPRKKDDKNSDLDEVQKVRRLFHDGLRFFEEENYAQAEKYFIDVIKLDMKNKDAYRALGDVYYAQGQLEEAKETYSFVVQLDKKDDAAYVRLAQIAEETGDINLAIEYLQQAVLLNDNFAAPFLKLSDLFFQIKQNDAALEAVEQAVNIEPDNHRSLDRLLELAIIMSRKDIADKTYRRLKTVDPNSKKLEKYRLKIDQL